MLDAGQIFEGALRSNASDVHLVVGKRPVFRVDGVLVETDGAPVIQKDFENMLIRMLTPAQRQRFAEEMDLDFSFAIDSARFRVNVFVERGNLSMVARVVPSVIPALSELHIPDVVGKLITSYSGLILVTGPTGSGKSTTLASMIERINNDRPVNIITLEDPIEFIFTPKKALVRQRELGTDMRTFNEGLKHVLRQDPDVIMVGEMRDPDTMATAITLAETGHLVLSTLHTPSAAQAVDRILDAFPAHQQTQIRFQLALSLKAIMAQQLLPQVGGGRIAAREILINTPAVGTMIRENKIAQIPNILQTSGSAGMFNYDMNLRELVESGKITQEVADAFRAPVTG
jgi:twitching motility protein PilT